MGISFKFYVSMFHMKSSLIDYICMDATVTIDDAHDVHRYTLFAAESLTSNARITEFYSTQVVIHNMNSLKDGQT